MRHIAVTTKKDQTVLIHVEDLKEAYPAADNKFSICVIRVADRDKEDTYLVVRESTEAIYEKLKNLNYERMSHGEKTI